MAKKRRMHNSMQRFPISNLVYVPAPAGTIPWK